MQSSALFIIAPSQPAKPPVLRGGHMRPGPTAESNMNPEPRFCEEPCPQTCAPACYDWCCYPAVQTPTQPVQLMLVPVANAPAAPPVAAPLPYPINYMTPADTSCSPQPCSAKKHEVASLINPDKKETVNNSTILQNNITSSVGKSAAADFKDNSNATMEENKNDVSNTTKGNETTDLQSQEKTSKTKTKSTIVEDIKIIGIENMTEDADKKHSIIKSSKTHKRHHKAKQQKKE